jgi:hypothetical protein
MRFYCFGCGKAISNELPEGSLLRAVAYCPECIESGNDLISSAEREEGE